MQGLDLNSLNKREPVAGRSQSHEYVQHKRIIDGVRSALRHLHSFGLVLNDLSASNIMLDEEDTPILIDFGSCRRAGETLQDVGRTYEWYDNNVETTKESYDWDALEEIARWMNGDSSKFKFDE